MDMTLTIEEIGSLYAKIRARAEEDVKKNGFSELTKSGFIYGATWMLSEINELLFNKTNNNEQDGQQDF